MKNEFHSSIFRFSGVNWSLKLANFSPKSRFSGALRPKQMIVWPYFLSSSICCRISQCQDVCQILAYLHVLFEMGVKYAKKLSQLGKMANFVSYGSFSLLQGRPL